MKTGNKTILFDIDDTLIKNDSFPNDIEETLEYIRVLKKKGWKLGINTNRPLSDFVKDVYKKYMLNGPIITEKGSCIYVNKNNSFVNIIEPKETIKVILKELEKEKDLKINKDRINSISIRFKENAILYDYVMKIVNNYKNIILHEENNNGIIKININLKEHNKFKAMSSLNEKIIFISDYEEDVIHTANTIIYSVGESVLFNKEVNKVYKKFIDGINEILKEIIEEEN